MSRRRRIAAGAVVLLLVAATAGGLALRGRSAPPAGVLASGTVEATEADLGFQLGGRIRTVEVREGDRVAAGQLLAELEAGELEARHAAAQAQLDGARAALLELERGSRPEERRQAEAGEAAARERLQEAERQLERTRTLEQSGGATRESLDHARTVVEVARAQHAQAQEQLEMVQRGARAERVDVQRAAVRQAAASVAQAAAVLQHARITAPFAGVVTVRHRQPGESVGAGAPVLTVMDPEDRWVRIYVREDVIGRVHVGQAASIRIDSEPQRRFDGRVTWISPQAEFTPRNVQTAAERVKLVYAVKVAVAGDAAGALKPGLPADVTLQIDP